MEQSWTWFWFSFEGRISRSTYWMRWVFPLVVLYPLVVLSDMVTGLYVTAGELHPDLERMNRGWGLQTVLLDLLLIYPMFAVSAKRLHDRNRTGWVMLAAFVPFLNLWLFVELALLTGNRGRNRYGAEPQS
ncbi:MAG: DUF805 domain-containing protein [Pirellulales bacterium]